MPASTILVRFRDAKNAIKRVMVLRDFFSAEPPQPLQGHAIKSAHYHGLDVTYKVQKMALERAKEGKSTIEFDGNFHLLFGDPAYGVEKTFRVVLSDGREITMTDGQEGIIELPHVSIVTVLNLLALLVLKQQFTCFASTTV